MELAQEEQQKLIEKYKGKSLADLYPDIAKEWDYEKNIDLTPQMVVQGSGNKVWWICPNGHSYDSIIYNRTSKNRGCPYCSGRLPIQGFNDLATTHQYIAKEWNYEKNYPLTPQMVSKGSNKKVWWICQKGHSYNTRISDRTSQNQGCPYCSGKKVLQGFNDLATTHPYIAKEWDYEKNYPLTPQMVSKGNHNKVWWICPNGHSYESSIQNRTNQNCCCPYCCGKKVLQGFNDLATTHPDIAKEWDYDKNYPLTPQIVSKGSHNKVWWICPKGHSYESIISNRTSLNNSCPYCAGKKVLQGFNDLATTHPDIAKEWDYEKNYPLKPQDITKGYDKKVWLVCPNGHSYDNRVANRTNGKKCPYCCGKKVLQGFNDLATTHPDIAEEWDYEKNYPLIPQTVSKGINKKYWWICPNGHSYDSSINNRTSQNQGCPICAMSKGERFIYDFLTKQNILFSREYKFTSSSKVTIYPHDIYFIQYTIIIEYDGEQHFTNAFSYFEKKTDSLTTRIKHDNIKNEFCLEQNIPILRIPYIYNPETDTDKIEHIVNKFIVTKQVPTEIIEFYEQYDFSNYVEIAKQLNEKNK